MKILVTGISGRIGANLAQALVDAGHDIRGLVWEKDLRSEKLAELDVELVQGSLVNPDDVDRAVDGIETIYHLGAAFQGGGPFSNTDYFEINARGTFNMLEAAQRNSKHLQHFFFASTDAIYQKYIPGGIPDPIQEDTMPRLPGGAYALTKVLGEEMCLGYHHTHGLPITIFRFALAVAGDEILNFPQFYLRHWQQAYANRSDKASIQVHEQLDAFGDDRDRLLIARDGEGRSYKKHIADVRDIVLGMMCGLGKSQANGQIFQLAGPTPFTWEETIPYLANKLGLEYVDLCLAGQNPTNYEFDLSKGKELLGYYPQLNIFQMIDDAIAFRQGEAAGVIPT